VRRRGLAPAAQSDKHQDLRDHSITAITATSEQMKATRGTKRVCQACAARFYDLSRDPIVCPSCGAHHVPKAPALVANTGTSASGFAGKTGWRGRLEPAETESMPDPDVASQVTAAEDAPAPNDDIVLDEEPDEGDISSLLSHHEAEPRER
jgi:uncharacterized protein (TIGR02300 family)